MHCFRWRARQDSNPQPLGPKPSALSIELQAHGCVNLFWRLGRATGFEPVISCATDRRLRPLGYARLEYACGSRATNRRNRLAHLYYPYNTGHRLTQGLSIFPLPLWERAGVRRIACRRIVPYLTPSPSPSPIKGEGISCKTERPCRQPQDDCKVVGLPVLSAHPEPVEGWFPVVRQAHHERVQGTLQSSCRQPNSGFRPGGFWNSKQDGSVAGGLRNVDAAPGSFV